MWYNRLQADAGWGEGMEARVRGMRGATTVPEDSERAIIEATKELLEALREANGFDLDDVVCALFTATPDLQAGFPAAAARELGWTRVPLLDAAELTVPGDLPRCVRVLLQVYTEKRPLEIQHVYLRDAARLRPDLA
jgi:chorismate mutase